MSLRDRSLLPARLRNYPDPSESHDPRVRLLLTHLSALPAAGLQPDARFRSELRQQLLAAGPRLLEEGTDEQPVQPDRRRLRRPLYALAGAATVVVLLLVGAVLLSGNALPGDSLYSLKRASESVQLSLTSGDSARGKQYLDQAGERAGEVRSLLGRDSASGRGLQAASALSSNTASLVTNTLDDQDADVRHGSQLLGAQAVQAASAGPLQTLINWTPGQLSTLAEIVARIPAGPLHDRAVASEDLVRQVLARAQALAQVAALPCQAGAATDALGPIPVTGCPSSPPVSGAPSSSSKPGQPTAGKPSHPGPTTSSGVSPRGPAVSPSGPLPSGAAGSSSSGGGIIIPPITIPGGGGGSTGASTGPSSPSPSCSGISLGPIGIGLNSCGISIGINIGGGGHTP